MLSSYSGCRAGRHLLPNAIYIWVGALCVQTVCMCISSCTLIRFHARRCTHDQVCVCMIMCYFELLRPACVAVYVWYFKDHLYLTDLCCHIHIQSSALFGQCNHSTVLLSSQCSYTIKFKIWLLNFFPVTSLVELLSQKCIWLKKLHIFDFFFFSFLTLVQFFAISN